MNIQLFDFHKLIVLFLLFACLPTLTLCETPNLEVNCDATFTFYSTPPNPPHLIEFQSNTTGDYTYYWEFGDGSTSNETEPVHLYEPGTYSACLTLSNNSGCIETKCNTVEIQSCGNDCSYVIEYYYVDALTITATIFNTDDFGPYHPQIIEWTNPMTGEVVSNEATFTYSFPTPACDILCASFEATYPDSTTCNGEICEPAFVLFSCFNPDFINLDVDCPTAGQEICGCDGITYPNECAAINYGGIGSWTSGPCSIQTNNCFALFQYDLDTDGVHFQNFSLGNYTSIEWSLGDGTIMTNPTENFFHPYDETDIYQVCITIASDDGCSEQYCDYIFTGAPNEICDYSDCVFPGDANGDMAANVYDLLNLGVGYNMTGPSRENASNVWTAQYAENWSAATLQGTNYKHLDCNGDGSINEIDIQAIESNYAEVEDIISVTTPGVPQIWLDFENDTMYINENSPMILKVSADLMVGNTQNPIEDLQGFALQLDYPAEFVQETSVDFDYNDNSFFGSSNQILWMQHDDFTNGVLDLGFSRKNEPVEGASRIGTIQFIIIVDIIDGRSEESTDFEVGVERVVAISGSGAVKALSLATENARMVIINESNITSTKEALLASKIEVFPNPVRDILTIQLNGLKGQKVELFNVLGQEVKEMALSQNTLELTLNDVEKGVYLLKVYTEEGVISQRIVVE